MSNLKPLPVSLAGSTGPSISMKINRTSVMLYANEYCKPPDGGAGHAVQRYLGSCSVNVTELPAAFHALLREGTRGQPERYLALMQRLQDRVLEPARQRQRELKRRQRHQQVLGTLGTAIQHLSELEGLPELDEHLHERPVQQAVKRLFDAVNNLQRVPAPVAPVTAPSELLPQEPAELASPDEAERCLQEQLAIINQACTKVIDMMPEAARQFKKGHPFHEKTVKMVQRSWFHVSDMQSALSGRTALRRPKSWDSMREQVMSACVDGE